MKSSTNWEISLENSIAEISYEVIMIKGFVVLLRQQAFIKLKGKEWST